MSVDCGYICDSIHSYTTGREYGSEQILISNEKAFALRVYTS